MEASTATGGKTESASNKEALNLPEGTMQDENLDVLDAEMWRVSTFDDADYDEVKHDMKIFGWHYTAADLCLKTPLHVHVRAGNLNLARLLLQKGADVDTTDAFGNTPLHDAVEAKEYEIACMLLYYGASVNAPNSVNGKTPFMNALESEDGEFVDLLFDYADFQAVDRLGRSILSFVGFSIRSFIPKILAQYEDVNSIEDISECLKEILCCEKISIISKEYLYMFKYVIERINQDKLVQEYDTILNEVMCIHFRCAEEFMECFYLVLSLDCAEKLVEKCSFKRLFEVFRHYGMDQRDRMSCLYSLLALNKCICVTYEEFDDIYKYFGFHEELEAIFQTRPNIGETFPTPRAISLKMASIIFYSYHGSINGEQLFYIDQRDRPDVLKDYIKFFTISSDTRGKYFCNLIVKPEHEREGLIHKLNDRDVPSLREICRNSIRKAIISSRRRSCMYEVYDAIKSLPVPKIIQDVLLLKRPLYV